jgi:hypothetical protein
MTRQARAKTAFASNLMSSKSVAFVYGAVHFLTASQGRIRELESVVYGESTMQQARGDEVLYPLMLLLQKADTFQAGFHTHLQTCSCQQCMMVDDDIDSVFFVVCSEVCPVPIIGAYAALTP